MKYKEIKEEMIRKEYADGGFVALGKNNKRFQGAVQGANSDHYAIALEGEELTFTPYGVNELFYKNIFAVNKSKIAKLKITGVGIFTNLRMITVDGHEKLFDIRKGQKDLKNIVKLLGF